MDKFLYKLSTKNKNYEVEDGIIVSSTSVSSVLDGVGYYTKIKNYKNQNEFEYDNPEAYLKKYPNVDELISFKELLDLIRAEFKVFEKD